MNNFNYEKVTGIDAAVAAASGPDRSFLGGGTNLLDLWKYDLAHPEKLVDLNGIAELKEITELPDGGLRLGALVTNNATAYHPVVQERYPLLSRTILAGAAVTTFTTRTARVINVNPAPAAPPARGTTACTPSWATVKIVLP